MKDKMTVKEFLKAGYKFEVGDAYSSPDCKKILIMNYDDVCNANIVAYDDNLRYVIKSAALEREEKGNIFGKTNILSNDNAKYGSGNNGMLDRFVVIKEQEWKNGDECTAGVNPNIAKFIGYVPGDDDNGECFITYDGTVAELIVVSLLAKPPTQQQKEEQAKLEAAYDLYCEHNKINSWSAVPIADFKTKLPKRLSSWLSLVDKTGYRVEK